MIEFLQHRPMASSGGLSWRGRLYLLPFMIVPTVGLLLVFAAKFGFELFQADRSVTISQTLGFGPNRLLAALTGSLIGLLLGLCHLLIYRYNRFHMGCLQQAGAAVPAWLHRANGALLGSAVWAGAAIALTLIFPSDSHPGWHEFLSYNLFIFCTATTVLDGHLAGRWRFVGPSSSHGQNQGMFLLRRWVAVALVLLSLTYLGLFLGRGVWLPVGGVTQSLYVTTEYAIILSYYLYMFAHYLELRRFFVSPDGGRFLGGTTAQASQSISR
ncbi:MAG: hypothetical protein HQL53_01110 [Magnetococcales bacterium]|nr:hypothetical protein [Magnetococcales bacterium]